MRRRTHQQGFTMVELLIAGFLGAIVLAMTYFVFIANSRQYYVQEQIVQMQEGMRFALEHLKNDLRNAGRLAVVNAIEPPGAPGSDGRDPQVCQVRQGVQAIRLFDNDPGGPAVLRQNSNGLRPDRVRMLVDGSGATPVTIERVFGRNVEFTVADRQRTRGARTLMGSQARYEAAFKEGLYLYVVARSGESDIVPIASARFDQNGSSIRLSDPLCPVGRGGSLAARCFGGGCLATPVHLVEYAVVAEEGRPDRKKTDLVRRTIDARNGEDVLEDSELVIAEYVVNLQLWGTYDTRNALALNGQAAVIPEDPDPTDSIGNLNLGGALAEEVAMNGRPHRLRSLNVLLATRTVREDEGFKIAPDRGDLPSSRAPADLIWFELNDVPETGYARVATMQAEVETPNMYRGQ
jgi:prepilin-type N-terminal cleavage/methylation domain-containing protein